MIHDNFRKYIRWSLYRETSARSRDVTDKNGYTGTDSDTLWTVLYNSIYDSRTTIYTSVTVAEFFKGPSSSSPRPWFGAVLGNSANDEPDYTLGDIITSECIMSGAYVCNENSEIIINTTITNQTDNDISFNEIGLFIVARGYSSSNIWNNVSGNAASLDALLIKEVLSTPQTLPANSSINISFNLFGDTPAASVTPA